MLEVVECEVSFYLWASLSVVVREEERSKEDFFAPHISNLTSSASGAHIRH